MFFWNEGQFYQHFIDPLLNRQHKKVANQIEPDKKIIDIASGTGNLAFHLAKNAASITGIDNSTSMIARSKSQQIEKGYHNIEFRCLDISTLQKFRDKEFDTAVISMAIHQFPIEKSLFILREMNRIASELIILDYSQLKKNLFYKGFIYLIEFLAGREHFNNFRQYMKYGGILALLNRAAIPITHHQSSGNPIFFIVSNKVLS